MERKSFSDFFYQSVEIFKNNFKSISPVLLILVLIDIYGMLTISDQSDAHNIISTLTSALFEVVLTVYLINLYLSKLTVIPFSLNKCFWDIPTYLFYELAFGVCFLVGVVIFVIPGIFVYFFFSMVPTVAIAFDHYESENEGIFSLTKRSVTSNKSTYLLILILGLVLSAVNWGSEKIFLISDHNFIIGIGFSLMNSLLICIYTGVIVSFLANTVRENSQIETGLLSE